MESFCPKVLGVSATGNPYKGVQRKGGGMIKKSLTFFFPETFLYGRGSCVAKKRSKCGENKISASMLKTPSYN